MSGPKLKCLDCGDIIISRHVHDWQQCTCGNIFIDGGSEYIRMGFKNENYMFLEEKEEYELEQAT